MKFLFTLLSHTPWWAFIVFVWLIFIGVRGLKERTIDINNLWITPTTFIIFYIYNIIKIQNIKFSILSVIVCIVSSIIAYIFLKNSIRLDENNNFMKQKSCSTLLCGMITFFVRYFCEYKKATTGETFIFFELISSAIIGGFTIGKNFKYFVEMRRIRKK